ncbi:hypothetical protein DFR57_107162 [Saliterribacillus persicus]|uniref:Uncharacterized protein n=1 Tax=Saliterribacillus persicus TaxID=930114 RepID=A0A368XP87_9BACI|nr:hypothetical protein DFR57_107162 [Saliterribacillus persicus]
MRQIKFTLNEHRKLLAYTQKESTKLWTAAVK